MSLQASIFIVAKSTTGTTAWLAFQGQAFFPSCS
jgi:hypothetical protein